MSSNANTPGGEATSVGTVAAHPSPRNDATPKKKSAAMKNLQMLGRSLMLPIAVLPAAALLLRLGQADMLSQWEDATVLNGLAAILAAGGGALFDNLPLLFAVGVAIGWAKKADGSTALAAVVGYLALFNGRRFVPIVVGFAAVIIAIPMVLDYPWFNRGLTWFGDMISGNTVGGGFIYGTVNRLLIPIGLHHLLNFVPWFMLGSFEGDTGVVHGDIARFLAGDPTAGAIDFLLNLGIAEKPWAIIVAGLIYAVIYYVIFRFMIVKLDLKTPGRDPEQDPAPEAGAKTEAA